MAAGVIVLDYPCLACHEKFSATPLRVFYTSMKCKAAVALQIKPFGGGWFHKTDFYNQEVLIAYDVNLVGLDLGLN